VKLINYITFLLTLVLVGCVSPTIVTQKSNDKYAVIMVDPLYPVSILEIDANANAHCRKNNTKAVFLKKDQGLMIASPAYTFFYYECIEEAGSKPKISTDRKKDGIDLKKAQATCLDLGFKLNTEGFGKCVLQLSK
jgi:uncharacterized protein YcfL